MLQEEMQWSDEIREETRRPDRTHASAFERSFDWIAKHAIFEPGKMGSGDYELVAPSSQGPLVFWE